MENYWEAGKVKQRFIRYLGKEAGLRPAAASIDMAALEMIAVKKYLDYKILYTIPQ